jgi:2-polyprenyl-6-methoxyphenol hydroxylase-like FAD-dependent oxidoreductase
VDVLVVEQDAGVAPLPRAVSIHDEAMRFMQALGLGEAARRVTLPGTATKSYGARGQLLAHARGPDRHRYGHPVKNPIDHLEFQRMLLDGLHDLPAVTVRHGTRLVGFEQDSDGVVAKIESDGHTTAVACRYLVGADGGRSLMPSLIGQEPMHGSGNEERGLVLDTIHDRHDERYAMHHGDPEHIARLESGHIRSIPSFTALPTSISTGPARSSKRREGVRCRDGVEHDVAAGDPLPMSFRECGQIRQVVQAAGAKTTSWPAARRGPHHRGCGAMCPVPSMAMCMSRTSSLGLSERADS